MTRTTCVVCGISWDGDDDAKAEEHIRASHPGMKKSIPIRHLIRVEEVSDDAE